MARPQGTTETMTFRDAERRAIREEMHRDDSVFLMGQDEEDGGSFDVTAGLFEEFGYGRVRNTPISEAAQIGSGVGAAATGLRPLINISFADFLGVCYDQVMNQAGKTRYMFDGVLDMPLVVRAIEGAGLNAAAQHSSTIHSMVSHLPGVKAVAPGTPEAAYGLMKAAIRSDDPVVFFENKTIYETSGPVPDDEGFTVPLGEASVEREGEDVTVVATQRLLGEALSAAETLAPEYDLEVIDPRSVYPLDTDTIADSVHDTGRIVVADESVMSYGLHSEVITRAAEEEFWYLDAPPQRVGVPDTPMPFAPSMEDELLPEESDIRRAVERTF